ncbi:hypothetical protein [Vreelandella olivaria]|uniref:hypothetical protein n=1 Tax=Vreelandella olivaria TaxID=390919 RepID=UPI00201F2333|nr:hypothetical protein [Halomonas olivaria]
MPINALVDNTSLAPHVALVLFNAGTVRAAIEAHHILSMSDSPTTSRAASADALLLGMRGVPAPTHWLTLQDSNGFWQLGVTGNVVLSRLSTTVLFPLPPLLAARHASPALCGLARHNKTFLLLFDGSMLTPELATQP